MLAAIFLFASLAFSESKALALQLCLDRAGYSCNTIDGVWGDKGRRALERYLIDTGRSPKLATLPPDTVLERFFTDIGDAFRIVTVTEADLASIVRIPEDPALKAALPRMGYESVKEMFAERGHLSQKALVRLNPGVDWENVRPGLKLVVPNFPSVEDELAAGERRRPGAPKRPRAELVRVSLSRFEITAFDAKGKCIGLFPCSIAANRAKVPAAGELKITSYVAWPNYTYTPDRVPPGRKAARYVFPSGPNCPVGVAWMGLNLPGYGIHGTPVPESIGFTGSHGCFRLANWNAARLYAMCRSGTRVIIDP